MRKVNLEVGGPSLGYTRIRCHQTYCYSELYVPYPTSATEAARKGGWVRRSSRWLRHPVWYCEAHA